MDADEGRDDWAEKEGHALQIALTLFHTAAKKKKKPRYEIKSTTHEIIEEAFQLHEKLIYSILGQEAIRLWGVSFHHKDLKGGISLENTLKTLNSWDFQCPLPWEGYSSQTSWAPFRHRIKTYHNIFYLTRSILAQ